MREYKWYQRVLFILAFLSLAAVTVYLIMVYGKIETDIPTHYNSLGEADAYGSKSMLIVLILVSWFLYVLMVVAGKLPELWNIPVKLTIFNRDRISSIVRTMLSIMTLIISLFFSCLVWCAAGCKNLPKALMPVFGILLLGTLIISIVRLIRNR